jgi:hypothetical protein
MTRTNRIALLAALSLLVAAAGTALATRSPQASPQRTGTLADEAEEAVDADALTHAIERLAEREIDVADHAAFGDFAERYGLGGAVRLHAWANETGMTVDELAAMRDTGGTDGGPMGWGRLAKDLREQGFDVRPGIGSIMGGGRGPGEDPPGQERKADD